MVRFTKVMEIIEEERLVENAQVQGEYMLQELSAMGAEFPSLVSNVRGRGMMCAIDMDSAQNRDQLRQKAYEEGLIIIGCGDRSIRFRPPLTIQRGELEEGFGIMRKALQELNVGEF